MYPTQLERVSEQQLRIVWSDGARRLYPVSELRNQCPCASCREKRREKEESPPSPLQLPVLSAAEAQPLRVAAMRPVGNYAYNIVFSDGHDTGIYTFDFLRQLGEDERS